MLKIAIIGYGFVGKATHKAFEHNAETAIIDPKYSTTQIHDLDPKTDVVFVCLPAPTLDDGSVDSSLIYGVFLQLSTIKYIGLVVLKSTLPPNTVDDLKQVGLNYLYSPEFLRETSWAEDAVNPEMIILAGVSEDCQKLKTIYLNHSHVPRNVNFYMMDYKEASLAKYAINTFLASKVVFMNQLYQLYSDLHGGIPHWETWHHFTETISADPRIGGSHLNVPGPDRNYGYGGTCFPKDVNAMIEFDTQCRLSVLRETSIANTKLRLL